MKNCKSTILTEPVRGTCYVRMQKGIADYEQIQGKTGLVRSVRSDGFLEVDFSCSGGECCVFLDAYLMEECVPPREREMKSNTLADQTTT
ncbi:hypothetical protein [uncultured Gimesia sp.]|uniref:hypothetical protein n=1 Tax=uncultured Gimesia sp. TaxID=1678688 RepID=UPI0030DB6FA4